MGFELKETPVQVALIFNSFRQPRQGPRHLGVGAGHLACMRVPAGDFAGCCVRKSDRSSSCGRPVTVRKAHPGLAASILPYVGKVVFALVRGDAPQDETVEEPVFPGRGARPVLVTRPNVAPGQCVEPDADRLGFNPGLWGDEGRSPLHGCQLGVLLQRPLPLMKERQVVQKVVELLVVRGVDGGFGLRIIGSLFDVLQMSQISSIAAISFNKAA